MSSQYTTIKWEEFGSKVRKLIDYVSLSTNSPINSDRWEEVIYHVLKSMGLGYEGGDPKWVSGSHSPGADLWTDQLAISAKAGKISKDRLVISSYRLTRFKDLDAMVAYIDGPGKNFDVYLCCAKTDTETERIYNIFLIPAGVLVAKDLKWGEVYNKNMVSVGWRGTGGQGVTISIRRKMSNQLWIELPLKYCRLLTQIKIPKASLGQALENILK